MERRMFPSPMWSVTFFHRTPKSLSLRRMSKDLSREAFRILEVSPIGCLTSMGLSRKWSTTFLACHRP